MKKFITSAAALALLTLGSGLSAVAQNQPSSAAGTAAASALPHKIALIDMAKVFQEYKKFNALREALRVEIEASEGKGKQMQAELTQIQNDLKQMQETGTFTATSPEFQAKEKAFTEKAAEFQTFTKQAQREFLQREAEMYKTIYLEVSSMVEQYAKWQKYTMVLRFNREDVNESQNPQEILQRMNKQVVYFQPQDDITDAIIGYLNKQYDQAAAKSSGSATR